MMYTVFFSKNIIERLYKKYIDFVPYVNVSGNKNYWKLVISDEQFNELSVINETKDLFLNIDSLLGMNGYFDNSPTEDDFDITGYGLGAFGTEYVIQVDKEVEGIV